MDVKIDSEGTLFIKRGSHWKRQVCQFVSMVASSNRCGDHCSLFGEPEPYGADDEKFSIDLCGGKWLEIETLIDERE